MPHCGVEAGQTLPHAVDALTHVEEWDAAGIALHLVDLGGMSINTGSSMGKMLLTMLSGFAEFERNMIASEPLNLDPNRWSSGVKSAAIFAGKERRDHLLAAGRPLGTSRASCGLDDVLDGL